MLIQNELEQKIRDACSPVHLEVLNESHLHGGAPRDPKRIRETHFKAVIVSDVFLGKKSVQQHQLVYKMLGVSMGKIHALGLHTYTPAEWFASGGVAPESPPCPNNEKHQDKHHQHEAKH